MKIAMVSRGDRLTSGASRGADDLARWLIEAGHSVTHFCREFQQAPASFQQQLYGPWPVRKTVTLLQKLITRQGFPRAVPVEYYARLRWVRDSFDLFHFFDLAGTISPATLTLLSRFKPVVFTVQDCSAFTGGCIYPMGCEKFRTQCDQCPQLRIWPLDTSLDHTGFLQDQRRRSARQRGIQYVFPSKWMAQETTEVVTLGREPAQIWSAIDPVDYPATPKKEARRILQLPQDRPIVLISGQSLKDERKGARYAVEAISQIADLSPILITLGHSDPTLASQAGGISIVPFGYVREPQKMALIYSAADVYLFTSLADNCPYTVLEAMSSGTAVVGFATGGVPELVISEETGLLVPTLDRAALVAAMRRVVPDKNLTQRWGDQARVRLETHFSKDMHVKKMCNLYGEFAKNWKS